MQNYYKSIAALPDQLWIKVTSTRGIVVFIHNIAFKGHANVVVKAMEGFSLSPSSIPEWAKVVPEDIWKNELLAGLKPKNSSKSNSR